jgi:AcrR family transcriptional regulator
MAAARKKQRMNRSKQTLREDVALLKRDRILRMAADLFEEHGYHGTTIDSIANQFGATKPFVYYHFKSKVEILIELCERGTRDALRAAETAIASPGTPTFRLREFVKEFTKIALENQQHVKLYFREQLNLPKFNSDRINRMRHDIDLKLRTLLQEGVATGEFAVEDPALSCLVIAGMISYAFAWYRRDGRLGTTEIANLMCQLVLNMVQPQASGADGVPGTLTARHRSERS